MRLKNLKPFIPSSSSLCLVLIGTIGGYFLGRRARGKKDPIIIEPTDQQQDVASAADHVENNLQPPLSAAEVSLSKEEQKAIITKKIKLLESIQAKQKALIQSLPAESIKVTLWYGQVKEVKEGKKWITSPLDIAEEVSKSFASKALVAEVNGTPWDMSKPLECDCELKIFTFEDNKGRDTFWHSSAHILGHVLEAEFGCKLSICPCTTDHEGFYYDACYGGLGLNDKHLRKIEALAKKAVEAKHCFERIEVSVEQALEIFSDNRFKVEIINELHVDNKAITVYRCGDLVDLCCGPHIPNTSFVKAFRCLNASSAYWKGNKHGESLQRVYGISYPDENSLKAYMKQQEEAKKFDHRVLAKSQELMFCLANSPGSWFFTPNGVRIYKKLMQFMEKEYLKRGYQEVITPNMFKMDLFERSKHAGHYKQNMFLLDIEEEEYGLKPMNCPGHCEVFRHRPRSYRELPLRMAEFGVLHRNEASGALDGLTRVRRFVQDDAHIFCRESQLKDELKGVLDFIKYTYDIFGLTFDVELSTRPKSYHGERATWDKAEAILTEALNEFGMPWQINEGDGAFYGPKIDFGVYNALKKKFQCATIQLDFQLPDHEQFDLHYTSEDKQGKGETPVMIHRAVFGSFERFFGILLEHYKGKWPFWLSPRQVIVCSVTQEFEAYALQVQERIHHDGYHVDVDTSDRTMSKKVREAQMAQYNNVLVVGDKEAKSNQVSIRARDKKDEHIRVMSIEDLLQDFKDQVEAFR